MQDRLAELTTRYWRHCPDADIHTTAAWILMYALAYPQTVDRQITAFRRWLEDEGFDLADGLAVMQQRLGS